MFRFRIIFLHAVQILFLFHSNAIADEMAASKFLVDTPVSRMEYSLDNLANRLQSSAKEIGVKGVSVGYSQLLGKISIVANCLSCASELSEKSCSRVIDKIRALAQIDESGQPYDRDGSFFSMYFESHVRASTIEPEDFRNQIDKMIYIDVIMTNQTKIHCGAPLLGAAGSFKRLPN